MFKRTLTREQTPVRFSFAALRSRPFTLLWLGGIVSYIGTQIQLIGTAWLVIQSTHSVLLLGVLSLCSALPMIILPPFSGMLAEQVNPIIVLKWARGVQITLPLFIAFLLVSGHLQLWMLCVHASLVGVATAFSLPTNQTLLPSLVPREDVQSATALQATMFASASLVGPALGGLLLQPVGVAGLFLADALSTLAVFLPLFGLHGISALEKEKMQPLISQMIDGLRSILQHRPLPTLLLMAICLSLLQGGSQVLLPMFAQAQFHVGADGYGWLRTASGAGAVLSGLMLGAVGNIRRKASFIVGATLLQASALLFFAHVSFYGLALLLICLAGFLGTVASALVQTQLYLFAPESIRSRTMALYVVALVGFNAIGGMIGGSLAEASSCSQAMTWIVGVLGAGMLLFKLSLSQGETMGRARSSER
ncbi:MFS transporter [Ktedonosporobacter rubrisoli]|uniref:MFS transporter n=1 Tax=Ktedonosporobacter rubrisoli TaxID=2509675 RepID=UPI0013EE9E0B|nr:MFS transporter [Ktedonosporobacter rubrisoli]